MTVGGVAPAHAERAAPDSSGGMGVSALYLLSRLQVLEARVRQLVARRRSDDPSPDDPFRGLYISDDHVQHMLSASVAPGGETWGDTEELARLEAGAAEAEAEGVDIRLRSL